MRVYLSGPIAGNPDHELDFSTAARIVTEAGHQPFNPVEISADHDGPCRPGYESGQGEHTSACYMRGDLEVLLGCDAIALLPGWQMSRGARGELVVARSLGLRVGTVDAGLQWVDFGPLDIECIDAGCRACRVWARQGWRWK